MACHHLQIPGTGNLPQTSGFGLIWKVEEITPHKLGAGPPDPHAPHRGGVLMGAGGAGGKQACRMESIPPTSHWALLARPLRRRRSQVPSPSPHIRLPERLQQAWVCLALEQKGAGCMPVPLCCPPGSKLWPLLTQRLAQAELAGPQLPGQSISAVLGPSVCRPEPRVCALHVHGVLWGPASAPAAPLPRWKGWELLPSCPKRSQTAAAV